ncbi:MAG: recombinase family protein [Pedobacter sp.]|nr:MAG: recombinase family protein [Pedobacter sp.]
MAKLDRLSQYASFIFKLLDSGVNFHCVDILGDNSVTVGILATLAQNERKLISSRVKSALKAKMA